MGNSTYVGTVNARESSKLPTDSLIEPFDGIRSSTCCTVIQRVVLAVRRALQRALRGRCHR